MGRAQSGGAVFGEVRVGDLVTMRIRAEEEHLSTQTCSHPTRVRRQGFCCSGSDRRPGRRPEALVTGESRLEPTPVGAE